MIGRVSRFGVPKVRSACKGVQGTGRLGGTDFQTANCICMHDTWIQR